MKYRKLGRTGLKVSEICLGTMTFGDQVGEAEATEIIKAALNAGVNFLILPTRMLRAGLKKS